MKLYTSNLVKRYKNKPVVNDVSFEVNQGEIVGLLGPNGAGKTTTFFMTVGLIRPNEGNVFLDDLNITKFPMYRRAQLGIGYLAQEASVFRKLSVEDNIKAVLEMTKLSKAEQKEKLESLLDEFSLQKIRTNRGDLLSGGERRRTEIARALASNPKFILLDEPFAGVDPIAVEDIQSIVATLKKKKYWYSHYRPQRSRNTNNHRQSLSALRRKNSQIRNRRGTCQRRNCKACLSW